jgi:cell division protein ZapA
VDAKQPVKVTIFNQPYSLLAQGDPQDLIDAAHAVDEIMHSIASRANTADTARIAVMACLHLADKLQRLDQKTKFRTGEMAALLDKIEQ